MRPFSRGKASPLLVRARTDPEAFAAFYETYAERILMFFVRRIFDATTAMDLMSETFAIAFEQRFSFRGRTPQEEQGWLYAIARSQLSLFARRGGTERAALARLGVPVPTLTDAEIERIEELADLRLLARDLEDALAALPGDRRRAVEMRVVEELDYEEVARRLDTSYDNARALVSRGLRQLARSLAARDDST